MLYHYADQDNQVVGPVSEDDLRALHQQGTITPDTNVFPEGGADWRPYRSLVALPPPPPPSLAPVLYTRPVRVSAAPVPAAVLPPEAAPHGARAAWPASVQA